MKKKRIYLIAIDKRNKRKFRIEKIDFEGKHLVGRDLINPDIIYHYDLDDVDRKYMLL